jgi:hypothetical protein
MAAVAGEDTSHAYDPAAARTTSPTIMIIVHSGPYNRVRGYRAHGCQGPEQSLETTLHQFPLHRAGWSATAPTQLRASPPAQHENNEHDYHDDDYRPDTDIHRLFLSWQRPASIADEVPSAIFEIGLCSATRT